MTTRGKIQYFPWGNTQKSITDLLEDPRIFNYVRGNTYMLPNVKPFESCYVRVSLHHPSWTIYRPRRHDNHTPCIDRNDDEHSYL